MLDERFNEEDLHEASTSGFISGALGMVYVIAIIIGIAYASGHLHLYKSVYCIW